MWAVWDASDVLDDAAPFGAVVIDRVYRQVSDPPASEFVSSDAENVFVRITFVNEVGFMGVDVVGGAAVDDYSRGVGGLLSFAFPCRVGHAQRCHYVSGED